MPNYLKFFIDIISKKKANNFDINKELSKTKIPRIFSTALKN